MKRIVLIATLTLLVTTANAQYCQVNHSDYNNIQITFTCPLPQVNAATLSDEVFNVITMDDFMPSGKVGDPSLPSLSKMIEISLCDRLDVTVNEMLCDTIDANEIGIDRPLIPMQPSRRKSDTTAFHMVKNAQTYACNSFIGAETIVVENTGIARNHNLARIAYNPIRWNPVTNQIIVVKSITITIHQRNADIAATKTLQKTHSSRAYDNGINTINTLGSKDNYLSAPVRYTIVSHSMFRGLLDDFAKWKSRQGFIVDLVYTDQPEVGSSSTSIKNYLKGLYDNATASMPAPTYVLFVGDIAQIPAFQLVSQGTTHYSDINYCNWTENDRIPDCFYGRFSAQNAEQLIPQIEKTLMYEQYTFPDDSYLGNASLTAGVDGGSANDNGYTYGDPAMDYIAKYYINTTNGFDNVVYYKNNTSFAPNGVTVTGSSNNYTTANLLLNYYNNGCGWANYSAHGSETAWSNPGFSNSDVANMSNNNKPMIMIGNCCLSNSFQIDACLGEALLRKGNNAGAVSYIGASDYTYWVEDFYWTVGVRTNINNTMNTTYNNANLGMYDRLFHSHGETTDKWCTSAGSMIFGGNMAVESSPSQDDMKLYYWQVYHLMGDPSLMPYIHGRANNLTAQHDNSIDMAATSFYVSTVPYAYIGFSDENGNLCGAGYADGNGNATVNIFSPMTPEPHTIVITAQGYKPYQNTINIESQGIYVVAEDMQPLSAIEAGKHVAFDISLSNLGATDADSLFIEFQSLEGNIHIDTTGIIALPSGLAGRQQSMLHNVCNASVWENVKDQSLASIKMIVRWGHRNNTKTSKTFNFTINAPKPEIYLHTMDSALVDNGSTTFTVTNRNSGNAALENAYITLRSMEPSLSISNDTFIVDRVEPGQRFLQTYTLSALGSIPQNRSTVFVQTIRYGNIVKLDTLKVQFGEDLSVINFDDNSWGAIDWMQDANPWELTNEESHSGNYSARSKRWTYNNPGNNKNSSMTFEWTSSVDDSITFYAKVSSEANYDKLYFSIDNNVLMEMSGTNVDWTRKAYFVPAGTHTFKFNYRKDYSQSLGSDCGWIDDIHLPANGTVHQYIIDSVCAGETYIVDGTTIATASLQPNEFHLATDTADNTIRHIMLYVAAIPEVTIVGGDVTIREGETVRLMAQGAERYQWNNGANTPVIDVYPTTITEYSVTGWNGKCSATSTTTITVSGTIGIEVAEKGISDILLYPNPAKESVIISCKDMQMAIISDINGRQIMKQTISGDNAMLNISSLHEGLYIIQIRLENGNYKAAKFLKK